MNRLVIDFFLYFVMIFMNFLRKKWNFKLSIGYDFVQLFAYFKRYIDFCDFYRNYLCSWLILIIWFVWILIFFTFRRSYE